LSRCRPLCCGAHGHIADGDTGQGAVCVDAAGPDLARAWRAGAQPEGAFRLDVRG